MPGRMKTSPVSAAACVALAVLAAACNPDSATTGPSGLQPKDFAANLRLVSGDQQIGPLGSSLALPIVVKVVDAGGQPVQGAAVAFSVMAGGGSINPAANVSDGNGIVASTWTLGTSLGENKAVAILTNNFVLDSTTFTATATAGPVAVFTLQAGNNQTAIASRALPVALSVKAADSFGNALPGVKVTWTPNALNGSVAFTTDTTAADGIATATWTLGTVAAVQGLTATVNGAAPLAFTATATPDTGRVMTVTASPAAAGSVSTSVGTVTLRVTDQWGNLVSGVPITWNDSVGGGGTLSANTGSTSAAGTASTTWTLGRLVGPQALRVRLTGRPETQLFTATATVGFSGVIAGNAMACGVAATTSSVYCWGAGNDGQLGLGTFTSTTAPTLAVAQSGTPETGIALQARQLSGGRNGFCSLTIARTLYCWGRQLGGPVNASPTSITLTSGGAPVLPNDVAIGEDFGCLLTLAGDGFCSGNNFNGQLGDGAAPAGAAVGTWVSIAPPPTFFSVISTGRAHACGIPRFDPTAVAPASQRVFCWGLNNAGQVGDGTTTNRFVPTAVTSGALRFDSTMVVTGAAHACSVEASGSTTAGAAWCWGSNGSGQLGIGAAVQSSVPAAVLAPAGGAVTYVRLYAGEFHTCGLDATGAAYCWGRNTSGELGTGAVSASSNIPVAVTGGLLFRSLSLGENFTCGVTGVPGVSSPQVAGTIYCWGNNQSGQLGAGTSASILNPAAGRVLGQP